MKPEILTRKNSDGLYEAFHILTKANGKKMKIFEVAPNKIQAIRQLKSLIEGMYRRETAYKLIKKKNE